MASEPRRIITGKTRGGSQACSNLATCTRLKVVGMPHDVCAASDATARAGVVVFEEIWEASATFFAPMTFATSQAADAAAFASTSRNMPLGLSVAVPEVPFTFFEICQPRFDDPIEKLFFCGSNPREDQHGLHARLDGEDLTIILQPSLIEQRTQLVEGHYSRHNNFDGHSMLNDKPCLGQCQSL